MLTDSGTTQGGANTSCLSTTRTYQALAVAPCGFNDGYAKFRGISNLVTFGPQKPTVTLTATPTQAIVHYSFPGTTSPAQRTLRIISAMTGLVIDELHPTDVSGDWPWDIPACQIGAESEMVLARAISCGGETAESEDALMIPACDTSCPTKPSSGPACVGCPIRLTNGNMRLTDNDPLPGAPLAPLVRNYDSRSPVIGAFGKGWSSPFDAWLRSHSGSDGRQIVMMGTERGDRFVFVRHGAAYTQVWPAGERTSGTLAYDASAATFTHREAGAAVARIFRASDGHLVAVRSLAGQYQIGITYVSGKPSHVDDSRGILGWTVTTNANGLVDTISVDGQSGMVWSYLYDAAGNLQTVKIGTLVWRSYTYGSVGLTEARDGEGRLLESHTYDANGNALDSASATDDVTSIAYNAAGARVAGETVTRVTYATGRTTDYFSRFAGGKMRTVELKGSCACGTDDATYAYDADGHIVREQNASGYVTVSSYDPNTGNLLSTSNAMKPAACDPATAADRCRLDPDTLAAAALAPTEATLTATFAYGDPNWPDRPTVVSTTSVVAGKQRRETRAYHPVTGELAATEIDGFRLPGDQIASGTMTSFYGDPSGGSGGDTDGAPPANPLAPAFDPGGSFAAAWLSLPQPAGLRKSIDGPRTDLADLTSFVYYPIDPSVPALLRGRLAATKNAAGHITRFENYDVFGNLTRAVEPNGVATESSYDSLGRVLTTTVKAVAGCDTSVDALCATDLTTTLTYYPGGPLKSEQRPSGGVTLYTYDNRGRMATLSRGPSATDLREQIETTYDPATGRKSLERYLAFENAAWAEKKRESYAYDTFARLTTLTHADGASAGYTYDEQSRIQSARDENHPAPNTTYTYDPAGRLLTVRQTLGSGQITTSYAYDVQGNLTAATDPNGNVTSYEFDDLGRMLKQTSPVTGVTTYDYDAAGDLVSTVDANGAKTVRAYDALGRVVSAISRRDTASPPPPGGVGRNSILHISPRDDGNGRGGNGPGTPPPDGEKVTWTYDDPAAGRFGIGRLASMTDPAGATSYAYERRGLLRLETRTFIDSPRTYFSGFAYDPDGNRRAIGFPYEQFLYTYDYAGRPQSVQNGSMPVVTSATWLPFGPLTSLAFGNGTTKTMVYDSRYRPLTNVLTFGTTTLSSHAYGYDAAGNITALTDQLDATYNRTFAYDALNRLTTANSGISLWGAGSYSYDAMGNMLTSTLGGTTQTFTYQGTTPKVGTVTYDNAGNEVSGPSSFAYSPRNLLTTGGYQYDGRGIRVLRAGTQTNAGITATWTYTPELHPLTVQNDAINGFGILEFVNSRRFVWFGDLPVAQIDTVPDEFSLPADTTRYTFTDHLGTPIVQTDDTGAIVWRAEYEPYGHLRTVVTGHLEDQPLRLPGQEAYPEPNIHGLILEPAEYYNIFRWYRAGWGRYTQADPMGLGPDINIYRYAASNPISIDDPLGLDTAGCDEIGKYAIDETPCRLECCAQHDRCYDVNHCSSGSWPDSTPKTACDTTPGCRKCNDAVKDCFKKCLRKELFVAKDDPKRPNYYCGAQHRFIRIPGDFANISDARKACECDYSKSCSLPSRPLTPTVPKSKP
jgi:RHS repeat-associated protein